MIEPTIIRKSDLSIEDITIAKQQSNIKTEKISSELSHIWANILKKAKDSNIEIWDGDYYRLENLNDFKNGKNQLNLGEIKYSQVKSLITLLRRKGLPSNLLPQHINTGALLRTKDDYYIFGVKNFSNGNKIIDLVGGGLQSSELIVTEARHLAENVQKEIFEEINISTNLLSTPKISGVLQASNSCVIFVFYYTLNIDYNKALELFAKRSDQEMSDILGIHASKVKNFLLKQYDYFPLLSQLITT